MAVPSHWRVILGRSDVGRGGWLRPPPAVCLALAASLAAEIAFAHGLWIDRGSYRSPIDGRHCCGENDCSPVDGEDVTVTPDGYRLATGEAIPFAEAHASGDRHCWRCRRPDGSWRCLFAPRPSA